MHLIADAFGLSDSRASRLSHHLLPRSTEAALEGRLRRLTPPHTDPELSPAGQKSIKDGPRPSRTTDWRRAVVVTRHGAVTYIGDPPSQSTPLLAAVYAAISSSLN